MTLGIPAPAPGSIPLPAPAQASRLLKLGEVKYVPRNLVGAVTTVDYTGNTGIVRALGVEAIDDVSRGHNIQEKAPFLFFADHKTNPDDVIAVPSLVETPDTIPIDWLEKGHVAKLNFAKLFTMKKISIPAGTRMVIDLYEETDPDYGPCVGMKLMAAQFVPKKKGAPRKKKQSTPQTNT
jgi:hypothetical protein